MSTDLSWFDKNIIPLTKGYKDFIKAKESTLPERWNKDGERKFSNKEKKYLQIHQNRIKKPSGTLIVPEVPVIPVAEKKIIVKNSEMENQITVGNENEIIVGKTTKYDLFGKVTEVKEFTSEESYLKAVQQQVGRTNFKNETLLRDPELLKKVDDLLVLDRKNILPLDYYIKMVNKEMHQISAQKIPGIDSEIVAKITKNDLFGKESEVKEYHTIEEYLSALEEMAGSRINFKHETFLRDPELLKKVEDIMFIQKNPNSLEHYIEMVRSEKTAEHRPENIHDLNYKVQDEKEEIIGKLYFFGDEGEIVEVTKYTSAENYIQALGKELDSDVNGFKFDTVLRDPELLKAVDDLVYGVYGKDNPNPLEHYINLVKNEDRFERYKNIPGSFSESSKQFIDTISSEKLLELKSFKVYNVEDEMRADNFETIKDLRKDINIIDEVLRERSNADKVSVIPSAYPELDALADKLREQNPGIPLNSPNAKVVLQQAIDIAKMPDEVQKAALEYINAVAFENLVIGDEYKMIVDSGKIVSGDEPEYLEFVEKTDSLKKILFNNEIHAGKLPKLESTVANYFTVLVGELKRNYSHEISQISSTNQFNYYEIRLTHQKDQEQLQNHKDQLKYLGFGEGEKLHEDLKSGIDLHQSSFELQAVAKKTQLGNTVNFALQYARIDQGDIVLNSYDGNLTNGKGDHISQNFKVTKDNHFSAKEAINLLEGRAVKIVYTNPLTDLREQAFVKLNLSEVKNQAGNYNFQTFNEHYGVNTQQIVENSNLVFDRPELRDKVIKLLEKGDIVNVKISVENTLIEAKAVLNPQYKTLNLYDSEMNRINTNKPIQGIEKIQAQEKSNIRQQSIFRGI